MSQCIILIFHTNIIVWCATNYDLVNRRGGIDFSSLYEADEVIMLPLKVMKKVTKREPAQFLKSQGQASRTGFDAHDRSCYDR